MNITNYIQLELKFGCCSAENKKDIDLVLMDIQMPVMDGYEATKEILNYKPYMKIIAQTAYQDDRSTVIENGCVDFIAKPFNRLQLTLLLKHYLK